MAYGGVKKVKKYPGVLLIKKGDINFFYCVGPVWSPTDPIRVKNIRDSQTLNYCSKLMLLGLSKLLFLKVIIA